MDPDDPRIALGSIVHDYLYGSKGLLPTGQYTREQADRILAYESMPELGASVPEQHAVYWTLRAFGDRWN